MTLYRAVILHNGKKDQIWIPIIALLAYLRMVIFNCGLSSVNILINISVMTELPLK